MGQVGGSPRIDARARFQPRRPALRIPMQIDYAAIGVLKSFQVVSWWGVPCRTPRCSGFAVLSAMVLKQRAKHMRPTERGVGTCASCGCQYSVKPEELERRIVEMRTEAQEPLS